MKVVIAEGMRNVNDGDGSVLGNTHTSKQRIPSTACAVEKSHLVQPLGASLGTPCSSLANYVISLPGVPVPLWLASGQADLAHILPC